MLDAFASFLSRSTTFSFPGMTISSGAKLPSLRSTPSLFFGRSLMCPTEASTVKSFPRYLLIVLALAGDSTITRDLLIAFLKPDEELSTVYDFDIFGSYHDAALPSQLCQVHRRLTPTTFVPSAEKAPPMGLTVPP